MLSGRRDLNPGPSVPQTDTLTKLRHVPLPDGVLPAGFVSLAQLRGLPETKATSAAPGREVYVLAAG